MSIIFFDLETSDKEFCGQILNYSFIRTNNQLEIEDELSGEISLSVLQIPSPEALLTNRIRIANHQNQGYPHEPQAMFAIASFIADSLDSSKDQVYLAGYNSTRFDLPFLRTSFIRNGINPYFSGKIKYRDVLQIIRKLYVSDSRFPECRVGDNNNKISLSLESVSKQLGLLSGTQSHHSREDVLLTIRLCQDLNEKFNMSLVDYQAYEVFAKTTLTCALTPNYDLELQSGRSLSKPVGLLSETYRAALWVDLNRYKAGEGRAAISWYNKNGGQLITQDENFEEGEYSEILSQAKAEFSKLTPDNFFSKSSCDIEQDIYRLDMQKISTLSQIIWDQDKSLLSTIKDQDLQDLISRYWLAYGVDPKRRGEKWHQKLSQYAHYRYGGSMFQLPKAAPTEITAESRENTFHPSLVQLLERAENLKAEAASADDQLILEELIEHIKSSPLQAALSNRSDLQEIA